MLFFAPEKLSQRRSRTPEGFLLVENVPIARTGVQIYMPHDIGGLIKPGEDGLIRIVRKEEEVFDPISIASFNGKPLVNEHPPTMVDPATWRHLALGVVMNPRRGTGEDRDLVVADIIVYDASAIQLIESGKEELSCGYNAEYFELGPGLGEQRNIIGNHLALVSEGRCGERCAIGDRATTETGMAKMTVKDWLTKHFGNKPMQQVLDEQVPEAAAAPLDPDGGQHIHLHMPGAAQEEKEEDPYEAMNKRLSTVEDMCKDIGAWVGEQRAKAAKDAETNGNPDEEEEKKRKAAEATSDETEKEVEEETGEKPKKTDDSAALSKVFQDTVALAEILVPGIAVPSFDAKATMKATLTGICAHRRKALEQFAASEIGKAVIADLNHGKPLTGDASCGTVRRVFLGAAAVAKRANNASLIETRIPAGQHERKAGGTISSIADLNRRGQELWGDKGRAKAN